MNKKEKEILFLQEENALLTTQLEEAKDTLHAIQRGEIDALVISEPHGKKVFTLKTADFAYRVLVEHMNEGAVTIDHSGTILYCNKSFAQLIGLPLKKVFGSLFTSYLSKVNKKIFEEILTIVKDDTNKMHELTIQNANKDKIPIIISISPMRFEGGERGLSLIITNLTDQKHNEQLAASEKLTAQRLFHEKELRNNAEFAALALQNEKDNLQKEITERKKLERQKDESLGMASHELKTPVTSIKAFTQVLQSRFKKEENMYASELLAKMNTQLDKLTNLISDLLDITKIEGGKLKFHESFFDMNELLEEIAEEMQRTTDRHIITVELLPSRSLWGDRDRIGQVLTNFLSNAIKYSPNSGKIIIRSSYDKKEITISVQDFGVGIPTESQAQVFERFFRVGGEAHETYPGLGLGLYISSEIIKRHNGRMQVQSEIDKGSIFSFTLPLTRKKSPQNKKIT